MAGKKLSDLSDDETFARWSKHVMTCAEDVLFLTQNRALFREVHRMFEDNPVLNSSAASVAMSPSWPCSVRSRNRGARSYPFGALERGRAWHSACFTGALWLTPTSGAIGYVRWEAGGLPTAPHRGTPRVTGEIPRSRRHHAAASSYPFDGRFSDLPLVMYGDRDAVEKRMAKKENSATHPRVDVRPAKPAR